MTRATRMWKEVLRGLVPGIGSPRRCTAPLFPQLLVWALRVVDLFDKMGADAGAGVELEPRGNPRGVLSLRPLL